MTPSDGDGVIDLDQRRQGAAGAPERCELCSGPLLAQISVQRGLCGRCVDMACNDETPCHDCGQPVPQGDPWCSDCRWRREASR